MCERDWRKLNRVPPTNPSPWSESDVWYPSFRLARGVDETRFREDDAVTLAELKSLRKLITGVGAKGAWLPPGSGIGPVEAKLPKRATDFLWCGFKLLASERAMEVLRVAGIRLPHGPVVVPVSRKKTDYVALQLDPIALYSKQTLTEMTLAFCSECGQCWMRDVRAKPNGSRQYIRERVPDKQGLVWAREGFEIIATESFVEAVRSAKLTGMEFEQFGVYC